MKAILLVFWATLWFLTLSHIVNAAPISMPDPDGGGPGNRFSFSLSGVIEGIASSFPFAKYNDSQYTLSGFFFSNGTIDFTQIAILPNPEGGGGGSIIALPNPDIGGGGNSSLCLILKRAEEGTSSCGPALIFTDGSLLSLAQFPSLAFNLNGIDTTIHPTVTTYSFQAAPIPEPSTLFLMDAGLVGLLAARRKKRS